MLYASSHQQVTSFVNKKGNKFETNRNLQQASSLSHMDI